jgi:uncharacterized membrane protein
MALTELRGHWSTAILAYFFYYILLMLPAALLDFLFGGAAVAMPDAFAAFDGSGNSDIYNSFLGADAAAIAGQQGRALISFFYMLIIGGPLLLGLSGFMLSTARGATPGSGTVLDGFNNFFKAVGTYLMIVLRVFIWCLPFAIVLSLIIMATFPLFITRYGAAGAIMALPSIIGFSVILIIAMMVFVVRVVLTYSQTFFLLVDVPHGGVFAALRQSRNLMFGNKKKLFFLNLSFFGWFVLLYAVLCIIIYVLRYAPSVVTLFVIPVLSGIIQAPLFAYLSVAQSIFYDILTGRRRLRPADGGFPQGAVGAGENRITADGYGSASGTDSAASGSDGESRRLYGNAGDDRDFRGTDEDRGSRDNDGGDM